MWIFRAFIISCICFSVISQTTNPTPSTTLRPEDERICVPGFECKHGYCVQSSTLKCVCDPGWIGSFCEKRCSIDCGQHGTCTVFNGQQSCVCDWSYTGPLCEQIKHLPTTDKPNTTAGTTSQRATTIDSKSNSTQASNVTDLNTTTSLPLIVPSTATQPSSSITLGSETTATYTLSTRTSNSTVEASLSTTTRTSAANSSPPISSSSPNLNTSRQEIVTGLSQSSSSQPQTTTVSSTTSTLLPPSPTTLNPRRTECFPGFVCENGHCPQGRLICICEKGWVGPFCEWPCNLNCGGNGRCNSYNDGVMYCDCDSGYSGDNCEHSPTTSAPQLTIQQPDPKICQPDIICVNGFCDSSDISTGCICDPGWVGLSCDQKCPIICDVGEICVLDASERAVCKCNSTNCTVQDPNSSHIKDGDTLKSVWYWYVIGGCAGVLILLVILLVLVPYCLWRQRAIFIMKIMYLFQSYEDDDDKLFDAFISYKSTAKDEDFVLRQLFPRLETDNNFKLCLHFRDFLPGETISNNIKWAVENSRRTILVLTPDYIQSEFCRFEYQQARRQMLRNEERIIPIILEDVSQHMRYIDDEWQTIVKSIKCLNWPGEKNETNIYKFWKRLELLLPKKREERHLCKKKKIKPKNESVKLRRFSKDNRPMSTDDSDFVRLAIDEDSVLNGTNNYGYRYSRDTNSMTALM